MKKLESDQNWNTLFLNPNAVLASISKKFNVSKSEIIDTEEDNLAVKMALAETQIIKETKQWLNENGVNAQVFDETTRQSCERSNKVIIVKNIPYEITKYKL